MEVASLGICMSSETMNWLANMGVDKKKLCYINPAHDQKVKIKKYVIGLTCRVQIDGRKREYFIDKLADIIDPAYFSFKIMGDSWDSQVLNLKEKGFEVLYMDHFIKDEYYTLISSLDYYLYMGMDEGQMGFVDAAAAGVSTIVTKQGYHLDALDAISHSFTTFNELKNIFLKLQKDRIKLVDSVAEWNWRDYTIKHVECWKYIMEKKEIISNYNDGLNSLIRLSPLEIGLEPEFRKNKNRELILSQYKHQYNISRNYIKINGFHSFLLKVFKRILRWEKE